MFHYTYRITNTKEKKYYYGVHSCKCLPTEDIGVKYFSSSKTKEFINDQKQNPQDYKYKILKLFPTRKEALEHEIFLHKKFNVGVNEKFYNESKQTSTGFDTTGKCVVRDKNGNTLLVNTDDPRFLSGELISIAKGLKRNVTDEHRQNLSKALTGIKRPPEFCLAVSLGTDNKGEKHPRFKGYYVTPMGKFDSPAALYPTITLTQMKIYCNDSHRIITKNAYSKSEYLKSLYTYEELEGKTYRDLGFWRDYIEKD